MKHVAKFFDKNGFLAATGPDLNDHKKLQTYIKSITREHFVPSEGKSTGYIQLKLFDRNTKQMHDIAVGMRNTMKYAKKLPYNGKSPSQATIKLKPLPRKTGIVSVKEVKESNSEDETPVHEYVTPDKSLNDLHTNTEDETVRKTLNFSDVTS